MRHPCREKGMGTVGGGDVADMALEGSMGSQGVVSIKCHFKLGQAGKLCKYLLQTMGKVSLSDPHPTSHHLNKALLPQGDHAQSIPSHGVCAQGHHSWGIPSHEVCTPGVQCTGHPFLQGLCPGAPHVLTGWDVPCCTIHSAASSTWGSITPNWGQGEPLPAVVPGRWEGWDPPLHCVLGLVPSVSAQWAVEE